MCSRFELVELWIRVYILCPLYLKRKKERLDKLYTNVNKITPSDNNNINTKQYRKCKKLSLKYNRMVDLYLNNMARIELLCK